ncbi:MAG: hypothetical protein OXE44_19925 [Nitrospinae bacterium]|nr:hypothetical protein [Nitrospinota bacterium]
MVNEKVVSYLVKTHENRTRVFFVGGHGITLEMSMAEVMDKLGYGGR